MFKKILFLCLLFTPIALLAQDNVPYIHTDLLYANAKLDLHRTSTRIILDGEDLSANHVINGYGPIVADAEKGIVLVRHYDTGLEEFKVGNVQILFMNETAKNMYLSAYYRQTTTRIESSRSVIKLHKPFIGKIRKVYIERTSR
jgi:hypothetical protein